MTLAEKLRDIDIYGEPVVLNFNKKGSLHKTYMGGLLTIMGRILILFYTITLLIEMFGFSNDTTNIQDSIEEVESLGKVYFNQSGYMPRIQIMNRPSHPIEYNNENNIMMFNNTKVGQHHMPSEIANEYIDIAEKDGATVITEVTSAIGLFTFINTQFNFTFDQTKCARDVGLILDAVAHDIALDSTYRSYTQGLSYSRANADYLITNQQEQTAQAIEFVRDELIEALEANSTVTTATRTEATTKFTIILDVL